MGTEDGIPVNTARDRPGCLRSSPEDPREAVAVAEAAVLGDVPFIQETERTFGKNNSRASGIRKEA